MKKKVVLILGGAFDPPTRGHAVIARQALLHFACDELWLMPSANRWDKTIGTSIATRVAMLRLFQGDLRDSIELPIRISTVEIRRRGPSNTYETYRRLRKRYPSHEFRFLVGMDAARHVGAWVRGAWVLRHVPFLVYPRPGFRRPRELPRDCIVMPADVPVLACSSTGVRMARRAAAATNLLTPSVGGFVCSRNLYAKAPQ